MPAEQPFNPEIPNGSIIFAQDQMDDYHGAPIDGVYIGIYELQIIERNKGRLRLLKSPIYEDIFTKGLEDEDIDLESLHDSGGNLGYAVLKVLYVPENHLGDDSGVPTYYRRIDPKRPETFSSVSSSIRGVLELLLENRETADPWARVR